MHSVYQSPTLNVEYDERGFFLLNVAEGKEKSLSELQKVADMLVASGTPSARVLVMRDNSYSTSFDVLAADLGCVNGLRIEKVAYFAPTTNAESSSRFEATTALRNVPWRIFAEKEDAIQWLLET